METPKNKPAYGVRPTYRLKDLIDACDRNSPQIPNEWEIAPEVGAEIYRDPKSPEAKLPGLLLQGGPMKIQYDHQEDILTIEFSREPIIKDVSYGWNINIGYSANSIACITILDAKANGYWPIEIREDDQA